MFQIIKFTLNDRIYPIECTLLELKIYCGPDKFYGRSKFGQYDEVKNRAPSLSKQFMQNVLGNLLLAMHLQY